MTCTCSHHLTVNAAKVLDPTRTTLIRNAFVRDVNRRFASLWKDIRVSVVDNDCFGLLEPTNIFKHPLKAHSALTPGAFAFKTSAEKVDGFMGWLHEQNQRYILTGGIDGLEIVAGEAMGNAPWSNTYIQSAYKRGQQRAINEMGKAGFDTSGQSFGDAALDAAFNRPFHAERVALLYTRTYGELKGVAQRLEGKVARELAMGMAEGRSPLDIARGLHKHVGLEKQYARTLARTEVIRAHHSATIGTYREAGLEDVKIQAEWSATGDDRVCPDCLDMDGRVFSLDLIEGLIPLHPNCRCCALPYMDKITKQRTPLQDEPGIGDKYRDANGKLPPKRGLFDKATQGKFKKPGRESGKPTPQVPAPQTVTKEGHRQLATDYTVSITAQEQADIGAYKGMAYHEINGELREQAGKLGYIENKQTKAYVRSIDGALEKAPSLKQDSWLFRGIDDLDDVFPSGIRIGDEFADYGFVSTTTDANKAAQFAGARGEAGGVYDGVVLKIRAPKGTRAAFIEPDSTEMEVLLPRYRSSAPNSRKMRVVAVDMTEGSKTITVEWING